MPSYCSSASYSLLGIEEKKKIGGFRYPTCCFFINLGSFFSSFLHILTAFNSFYTLTITLSLELFCDVRLM